MLNRFTLLLFILLFIGLNACKKKEEIIIGNNTAPPDNTIENVVKENYINKVYISLLARKPDTLEQKEGLNILNDGNFSLDSRTEFIDKVFLNNEYFRQESTQARAELVDGEDSTTFHRLSMNYNSVIMQQMAGENDTAFITILRNVVKRLDSATYINKYLINGDVSIIEMHRIFVDNIVYDNINMGTQNFVVSMFQNFLFRYPTTNPNDSLITKNELENAKLIVDDGFQGILFMKIGKTKQDFFDIWFDSNEYYEGQVRNLYKRYLFREARSEEMTSLAINYKNTRDFKALQKHILILDEYVGLK